MHPIFLSGVPSSWGREARFLMSLRKRGMLLVMLVISTGLMMMPSVPHWTILCKTLACVLAVRDRIGVRAMLWAFSYSRISLVAVDPHMSFIISSMRIRQMSNPLSFRTGRTSEPSVVIMMRNDPRLVSTRVNSLLLVGSSSTSSTTGNLCSATSGCSSGSRNSCKHPTLYVAASTEGPCGASAWCVALKCSARLSAISSGSWPLQILPKTPACHSSLMLSSASSVASHMHITGVGGRPALDSHIRTLLAMLAGTFSVVP
mmetsp:Transcript_10276/g.20109  ORF Transcript_10276/g.20109 Transcript_10276/m.20109 type:complete len:260 (+) Transcript_10276:163-942(+)